MRQKTGRHSGRERDAGSRRRKEAASDRGRWKETDGRTDRQDGWRERIEGGWKGREGVRKGGMGRGRERWRMVGEEGGREGVVWQCCCVCGMLTMPP